MVSPFLYATFIFAVFHFNGNFLSVILLCSTMLIPSFVDSPAIFKSLGLTLSGPVALSGFIVVSCFPRNVVSTLMFCKVGVTEVIWLYILMFFLLSKILRQCFSNRREIVVHYFRFDRVICLQLLVFVCNWSYLTNSFHSLHFSHYFPERCRICSLFKFKFPVICFCCFEFFLC